jgi:hypothetical protein
VQLNTIFPVSFLLVFFYLRFGVLKEVNTVFWDVTSCSLVDYHEDGGSRFSLNINTIYKTPSRPLLLVQNVNGIKHTCVEAEKYRFLKYALLTAPVVRRSIAAIVGNESPNGQ